MTDMFDRGVRAARSGRLWSTVAAPAERRRRLCGNDGRGPALLLRHAHLEAAPLLCAGLIGFRAWRMAMEGRVVDRLGLYGFGAAAHLLAQLAIAEGQKVYAFTKPGDLAAQGLALVPLALRAVRKGGAVVCTGIPMSQIPALDYADLRAGAFTGAAVLRIDPPQ